MGTPFVFKSQSLTTLPNQSTPKYLKDRKIQQTLQFTPAGDKRGKKGILIDSKENSMKADNKTAPHKASVKIFQDQTVPPECPVTTCSRDSQTDEFLLDNLLEERLSTKSNNTDSGNASASDEQAVLDLFNDTPSEGYWKDVAEERRRALNDTLEENKRLYELNDSLRERAEEIEAILKDIMPDEGCGDSSDETSPSQDGVNKDDVVNKNIPESRADTPDQSKETTSSERQPEQSSSTVHK